MYLPGFCYGNISCLETSDLATSLIILGFSRDDRPGILAVGMNMSGYFLPWVGMPDNNR